ncbi:MAG: Glycosyl transferase family 2 [Methanomassiliicoccales archaeon PtaU1.Bin030]|nr:MAG: Glycosyl transferase family 2 [Methanomassiliicoccales archaeon PtaU1.Bin030]
MSDKSTDKSTLSLVIPTMDKYGYLSRTLIHSTTQGFREVIVVDSSIKEKKEIEELCKKYHVRLIQADMDRLEARNYGAFVSNSEWVAICDDDVIIHQFDMQKFSALAAQSDFFYGGWGEKPTENYAWIFRRRFFLDILKGYDGNITGGDDLDITLRSKRLGRGVDAMAADLYRTETIGMDIFKDYPSKWIRNKVHYSLTIFPLYCRHKHLIPNIFMSDGWRLNRIMKGEPPLKVLYEGFIERAGLIFSPLYYLLHRGRGRKSDIYGIDPSAKAGP